MIEEGIAINKLVKAALVAHAALSPHYGKAVDAGFVANHPDPVYTAATLASYAKINHPAVQALASVMNPTAANKGENEFQRRKMYALKQTVKMRNLKMM